MVDHTCFKQSVSNLTYACAGAEISCPYRYEDSCHIRGTGTLSIIVPEEYDYGYLDLKSDEAAASVTVQCSPDHKDTMTSTLEWTQSTSEYQCTESGASYCCPFGERFRYQPGDHVATESDFDYNLVDLDLYIPDTLNFTDNRT